MRIRLGGRERLGADIAVATGPKELGAATSVTGELLGLIDSQRWLTREQFLRHLTEEDRTNVPLIENFLQSLPSLSDKFEKGDAGIFVVGTAALPAAVLDYVNRTSKIGKMVPRGNTGHYDTVYVPLEKYPDRLHPRDIDLRVVVDNVDENTVADEIAAQFPKSFLRGLFSKYDFPRDVAYDDILTKKRIMFYPIGGSKRIDVLFPGFEDQHTDIERFLEFHVNNLRRLPTDLQEKPLCFSHEEDYQHARHLIVDSFTVRLV